MDRRTAPTVVAAAVADAMKASGVSPTTLSEATGIPVSTLRERLDNQSEFTWGEIEEVGGFLHVQPSQFFEGVAA